MAPDLDLRTRLHADVGPIGPTEPALAALHQAVGRRTLARRVAVTAAAIALVVGGVTLGTTLAGDEDPSEVQVADTRPDDRTEPGGTVDPDVELPEDVPALLGDRTVAIVSVDADGIIRVNGIEWDPDLPSDEGPLTVIDAHGAGGSLIVVTDGGVFLDGTLWHQGIDSQLFDVVGPKLRNLIAFTIPDGGDPSGRVIGVDEWGPAGRRDFPVISVDDLGGDVVAGSFGWTDNESILLTIDDGSGCNRHLVLDLEGVVQDDAFLNRRSACFGGEIAGWSEAGHTVLARPTEEDTWILTVVAKSGRTIESRIPGAFQPRHIDVHTTANGRTEALILGTGEETVFLDVQAYVEAENPDAVIGGFVNEPPVRRIHLVGGFEQHDVAGPDDEPVDPKTPAVPGTPQDVYEVTRVASDDVLNARRGPGVENPIVFTLAADATGVVAFGDPVTAPGGGEWIEVYNPVSGLDEEDDSGWVSLAFLRPQPVPDARPCLFNGPQDHYIGGEWSTADRVGPDSTARVVSSVDTYRFGGCIRTVIQFGTSLENGAPPATGLPADITVTAGGPTVVDLGSTVTFARSDGADSRAVGNDGWIYPTFVAIDGDGGLSAELYMPSDLVGVEFDSIASRIVIDVADGSPDDPRGSEPVRPPIERDGVVVTGGGDDGAWFTVTGLARPFEATLGLSLRNADGPVAAEFRDTFADPGEAVSSTGVMTTGWVDGWGRFSFEMQLDEDEVDGLLLDFVTAGGLEDPPVVTIPLDELRSHPAWRSIAR